MVQDDFDSMVLAFKSGGGDDDELVDYYPEDMMGEDFMNSSPDGEQ